MKVKKNMEFLWYCPDCTTIFPVEKEEEIETDDRPICEICGELMQFTITFENNKVESLW